MGTDIEGINAEIATARDDLLAAQSESPRDPEWIKRLKDELRVAIEERVDFWRATFKSGEPERYYDAYWIHEEYGNAFKAPTRAQIKQILETLDNDHPGWDSVSAEPFFATLAENFPDKIKAAPAAGAKRAQSGTKRGKAKAKGGGCLVVFAIGAAALIVALMGR